MPDFQKIINDPDFKKFHVEDKREALSQLFPDFKDLGTAGQNEVFRTFKMYPEKGPELRPKASEQSKIYTFLEALPATHRTEVQKEAIRHHLLPVGEEGAIRRHRPSYFEYAGETIGNMPRNARDIVKETGALLLGIGIGGFSFSKALYKDMVSQATGEPESELKKFFASGAEMAKNIGKEAVEGYKEFREEPGISIGNFVRERPLDAMILGNAAKAVVGRGLRVGAKNMQKVVKNKNIADKLADFASTERTPLSFELKGAATEIDEAGKSFLVEKTIKDVKFAREYSKDSLTKYIFERPFDKVLDKYPNLKAKLAERKANKLIDSMRNSYEELSFKERVKYHADVLSALNKLDDTELELMVPYLEGRLSFVKKPSENVLEFEKYYKDLVKKVASDVNITAKIAEDRAYQPLLKATGLSKEKIKEEFGDFAPVYVRHLFDKHQKKMGVHFTETTSHRFIPFIPDFFKKSKGVGGYSENLKEVLPRWLSEYVKYKNTEAFIGELTEKFGIPANLASIKTVEGGLRVGDKVYSGYRIVAPDGYLRFYRGKTDAYKMTFRKMAEEGRDFDESIGAVIADSFIGDVPAEELLKAASKEFVGVAKNQKVYLVPENVAERLESHAAPIISRGAQNFIKVVYDTPVGIWKDSVLAFSPRWIKNNVLGDIMFNTMEGVGPLSYGRAFRNEYKNVIPDELLRASFANVMKYNPKLGLAAKTTMGKMVDRLYKTGAVRGLGKAKDFGYTLNTMFEQPFVRSLYVKLARDKAKYLLKLENKQVNSKSILDKMETIKNSASLREPIVKKVKDTLPVFNLLGNYERKYARRIMPFYNWYKFMVKYTAQMPKRHPFKLAGARGLGSLAEEEREGVFKDYFPYMGFEIDESGIPDRFDNLWPVGYSMDGKAIFFNSRGMNVFSTIEDIVNLDFMSMMSPFIKVPVESIRGEEEFSKRKFETAEHGLDFEEFRKQRPPLGEHILRQFPQYTLLKEVMVPGKQLDSGTLFNPEPILNKITGEYVYPVENIEKVFNFLGIDKRTVDVRRAWDSFKKKKGVAVSKQFKKYQSKYESALSFKDIVSIFNKIKGNKELWDKLNEKVNDNLIYRAKEKKRVINIIKE
jgi:hypothetical protein